MISRLPLPLALLFSIPALAQDSEAQPAAPAPETENPIGWDPAMWELEDSDFTPEPGWHFGRLDNGMRYILRRNNRPEGTALVRMEIAAGSLDERDDERGYAHFVEHMAFNGSTNVPEGEMIKLLERLGLAFGADTNASTGFERTQYKLDLPRADEELLDTALMLMRETASELTITEEAVERERGVILSERRVRNTYSLKNVVDGLEFAYPGSLASERLPIGTIETLEAANAAKLRAFWEREYVPASTVLVIVGDFDTAMVEAKIKERFASWEAAPSPDQPDAGPVNPDFSGETDIYLDPALSESVTLSRHAPYLDRPDTLEQRQQGLLRRVGARILGRRLQRLRRSEDPPFRSVNTGASNFFESGRTAQLAVSSDEGGWKRALDTAIDEYRRILLYGVSQAEIDEQLTNIRTGQENAVATAGTRSNRTFERQAFAIARSNNVPTDHASSLARFETFAPQVTPEAVLEAMLADQISLEDPLIRFSGKTAPEGGAEALREAVETAFSRALEAPKDTADAIFAYTDFGTPSEVISDSRTEELDIRTIRFANGVMLNLKQTDLQNDVINISLALDGGGMLNSREDPLAVELASLLPAGGLGQHSTDELQSILAGRSVGASFSAGARAFNSRASTTPRDFELQMQVMAAFLADPGFRPEGLGPWRKGLEDFFARIGRTPGSALGEAFGPALSDNDPRFSRQPIEAYRGLDYDRLRKVIAERMANGAIEIGIVGDFDEAEAIRFVANTFGAMPGREIQFREYNDERRERSFTNERGSRTITHKGEDDQAQLTFVWPTTDTSDWELSSRLSLLARVLRLELTDTLREELGQTYSPSANSRQSDTYRDYGTFSIGAAIDVKEVEAARAAMLATISRLASDGPSQDTVDRARQPLLESLDNRLKTNRGWMGLVARAQSRPEDIARFLGTRERQEGITPAELQALAARYLAPADAVEFVVLPEAVVAHSAQD
ncbi:M16 family metallopeptidase [Qipengyuania sp. DGS5-3]|uniref:M16 family metallopeptidase n=1 Tax=Qipengyuania sp. DGS5-3 TaxID=3349632 RepID=UPI0036D3F17F